MKGIEIDHRLTDEITCPHCGCEFGDSWEYDSNEEDLGLIECDECGKSFYTTRNISVSYSTTKANYGTCKQCNMEDVIENYTSSIGSYKALCPDCGLKEKKGLAKEYFLKINEK